ncbi:uncharacterized protein A1O5_02683 [Cladophialophora psammophila CBS 110553]|uniref:Uncharacterized protein n=1 Tax=Cladophialophora psammophila CBS 110553 TaxID=1182543 RepID=W9X1Q7_9EURO|nr:uncharacterized protein A1O5_02683 [Cladophialophora psammophila CBS 110553]EXJ74387.1 hypothetical protein A1O5_02683 [Cladophialophora psammophila CBS 110553]
MNARLAKLYGRHAPIWKRTIQQSARALEQKAALRTVRNADDVLRATGKLKGKVAKEAAEALPEMLRSIGHVILEAEREIKMAWETFRIARRIGHLQDCAEGNKRRPYQRSAAGGNARAVRFTHVSLSFCLLGGPGIEIPKGPTLEFIPSRLIKKEVKARGHPIEATTVPIHTKGLGRISQKVGKVGGASSAINIFNGTTYTHFCRALSALPADFPGCKRYLHCMQSVN